MPNEHSDATSSNQNINSIVGGNDPMIINDNESNLNSSPITSSNSSDVSGSSSGSGSAPSSSSVISSAPLLVRPPSHSVTGTEESKYASSSVIAPSPSSYQQVLSPITAISPTTKQQLYNVLTPSTRTDNTTTVDSIAGVRFDEASATPAEIIGLPNKSLDTNSSIVDNGNKILCELPSHEKNISVEDGSLSRITPAKAGEAANNFLLLMERLRTHWLDCPDVYIQYQNLNYSVRVPIVEISSPPNFLWSGVLGLVKFLQRLDVFGITDSNKRYTDLHAIEKISGVIEPASMTLILAPPGHGKSVFLKSLAGRLSNDKNFSGEVLYNGVSSKEALSKGVRTKKLVAFVGQNDIHFPVLTVKETLDFVAHNSIADVSEFHDDKLIAMEKERAEYLIHMLGLEECKDTILGNDLLRGISGGQKKRVTIGEMIVTNARVMLLDEVSTGLDSAVAYHIFHALQQWCKLGRGSIVTALLQPTPETYSLFDKIILMRDGRVIYDGPRDQVRNFFATYLKVDIPVEAEEAGFIVDFLTDPRNLLKTMDAKKQYLSEKAKLNAIPKSNQKISEANGHENSNEDKDGVKVVDEEKSSESSIPASRLSPRSKPLSIYASQTDLDDLLAKSPINPSDPATTTEEMHTRFITSSYQSQLDTDLAYSLTECQRNEKLHLDSSKWSSYTKKQYAQDYPHSYSHHFKLAVVRQTKLFFRNMQVIKPRIFQCVLMGIVYGTLFYQLNPQDFSSKFGLILYLVMFGAFANLSELPVAAEARAIVTKQVDAGFYPTLPYIFSVIFWNLPLAAVETIIFGTMMYWLTGFVPDAGRFFFFLLVMWSSSLSLSTFFRTISYCTPNPDVARQLDFPFIILFIIFGGFLIPYSKIPKWLIWAFWISPFSWGLRSLSLNEFHSSRYDYLYDGQYAGDYFLSQYDVDTNDQYKWAGVGYLLGFFLTFAIVSSLALTYIRTQGTLGTKRLAPIDPLAAKAAQDNQNKFNSILQHHSFHQNNHPGAAPVTANAIVANGASESQPSKVPNYPPPEGVMISGANGRSGHISVPIAAQAAMTNGQGQMGVSFGNSSFHMNILPFVPVVLAWTDIEYFVTVKVGKVTKEKQLLRGISGYSVPGTLTALMGSSGAGKTTLMGHLDGKYYQQILSTLRGLTIINIYT